MFFTIGKNNKLPYTWFLQKRPIFDVSNLRFHVMFTNSAASSVGDGWNNMFGYTNKQGGAGFGWRWNSASGIVEVSIKYKIDGINFVEHMCNMEPYDVHEFILETKNDKIVFTDVNNTNKVLMAQISRPKPVLWNKFGWLNGLSVNQPSKKVIKVFMTNAGRVETST